jgi:hypothetical protein
MKRFIEYFSAKVGKEDILKPTPGNESLHEIINNNGIVHFSASKCLTIRSIMFSRHKKTSVALSPQAKYTG